MTSNTDHLYVWAWLPGTEAPIPVGTVGVAQNNKVLDFSYATSYRNRSDAIAIAPDLPLGEGPILPKSGIGMPGSIRDGLPDGWGRRVLHARYPELPAADGALTPREELAYMRLSGTNRFGGIDFQASPTDWVERETSASLDELHEAASRIDAGKPLSPDLESAVAHGTTIGGARPKALIHDGSKQYIAKFSAASDILPVIQAEAASLQLARAAGIAVPDSFLVDSLGRKALLVERFDRFGQNGRRLTVSALTLSGLDEMQARHATYPNLLNTLQAHSDIDHGPILFDRIVFNMAISNSDDHARNHAAFWDGNRLTLTPAYDLAPGPRSGESASQAMAYAVDSRGQGITESSLPRLARAAGTFGLTHNEAEERIEHITESIRENWDDAADTAGLTVQQRQSLLGRQFLNNGIFYDYNGGQPMTPILQRTRRDQGRHRAGAPRSQGGRFKANETPPPATSL